eukprot:m.465785 g.465785  ORF g.465785 m.465785 type:complete len:265 (+) comp24574_c0_seq1:132-926(+)
MSSLSQRVMAVEVATEQLHREARGVHARVKNAVRRTDRVEVSVFPEAASSGAGRRHGASSVRRAIVVMGGAFNPVHTGHLEALIAAKEALEADPNVTVVSGHFAVAPDGYVRRKCDDAIPAEHRIAMCNALSATHDWLVPTDRPFGSAGALAATITRMNPTLETVIVGGSDKLKGRTPKEHQARSKGRTEKMYVSRGDVGTDGGVLKPVKAGLSSTVVRKRLRDAPGLKTMKLLAEEGLIALEVTRYVEENLLALRETCPILFG